MNPSRKYRVMPLLTLLLGAALCPSRGAAQALTQPLGGATATAARPTAVSAAPSPSAPPVSPGRTSVAPPAPVASDYRLDTGDSILIRVARHDDVSGQFMIPTDGTINLLRLRQPIQARGLTCAQLTAALAQGLSHELRLYPGQISVAVVQPRVRRIFVQGNATRGADFDLKNGWRVSELISILGGVPTSERIRARLLNPNRPSPLTINLQDVLDHPETSPDNVLLQEGDTLTLDLPRSHRLFVKGEGPRGMHEIDERFGLKRALVQLGFSTLNATGSLRKSVLIRNSVPGDPNSPEMRIPVNLYELLSNDDATDVPLQDLDTLYIPTSEDFIYVYGEIGGARKWYLPQDRKTYLNDVIANGGGTSGAAAIGKISVFRVVDGTPVQKIYDFGKFLGNHDPKNNPEILAGDTVYVPNVKRPDIGSIWTVFGLRNLLKTFVPGVP